MKFPLATPAFPPVELSPAEREHFEALGERKLNEALAAFDAFDSIDAREVDRNRWKPVKTREGVTVFRERLKRKRRQQSDRGADEPAWRLPRLLGVGTLLGTLDDVMYGSMSPTAASVMVKADYCDDEVVDAQVLHEMRGPTLAKPFQFLGLKWLVKRHPVGLDAVVLPRDLVYLETTGVVDRADGSRVGHFLIHSVDLPERCGCLRRDLGIIRSRISSCFLFRERPRSSSAGGSPRVDVFMTGQVEPNGRVLDRAALVSAASGLMCFGRAVVCAQLRKLSWRLRTAATQRLLALDGAKNKPEAVAHHCGVCSRAIGTFTGSASACACEICGSRALCSRCTVTKTLSFVGGGNDRVTHRVPVTFCRPCVLVASRADAAAIAREEIRAGEFGCLTSSRSARSDGAKKRVTGAEREDAELSSRSTDVSLAYLDDLILAADPLGSEYDQEDDDDWKTMLLDDADDLTSGSSGEFSSSLSSDASGRASESLLSASSPSANAALSASTSASARDQLLWAQISVLRQVAEATYHFAKENTEQTLLLSSSGSGRKSLESLLPHKTLVP